MNIAYLSLAIITIVLILYLLKTKVFKTIEVTENYESGEIRRKYNVKRNAKIGKESVYYKSGKLNKVKEYSNGMLNGKAVTYYESGKVYITANYINGDLAGDYCVYDENDKLLESIKY